MKVQQQILKGAEELFFRYGLKSITMDDIAKHLGMSKRTIYENYPTKDSIISALLTAHRESTITDIESHRKSAKNAVEEIILTMQHLKSMSDMMNPRLLFELKKFHPKVWGEFLDMKQNIIMQCVADNIKWGIKQSIYRKELDVETLARLRVEQLELAWNPEVFPSAQYDITKVQLIFIDHFLYGLVNAKGYELIEKYKKSKTLNVPL
ncbi:MAG TPA: TetR/AcrR family transcriptional regulator [Bacteroidia bacterium]|jgi:AcrR family transcriptional regulator|nr:TetR/AcrR family transcriptional regulator [Bacteroidia bacterium]